MPQPKEYTIPAKELTKFLKACKIYQEENELFCMPGAQKDFNKAVNHFFHFNCGVKPENLTTEKVLSDKFKIC